MAEQSSVNCQVHAWPKTVCTVCTVWFNTSYPNCDGQNCLARRWYWDFQDCKKPQLTTEGIYSGHLKSLMEERVTLSGWQQLCKRHPSHEGNWENLKGTCTQAGTDSNFSLPMLHVGWIWSSGDLHNSQSVGREGEAVRPNLYRCALRHPALFNILLSNCKKKGIRKTGNAVVICPLTKYMFINHSALGDIWFLILMHVKTHCSILARAKDLFCCWWHNKL